MVSERHPGRPSQRGHLHPRHHGHSGSQLQRQALLPPQGTAHRWNIRPRDRSGVGLYVDGGDDSVWGPGTSVAITKAEVGGSGTIRAQGTVSFTSGGPDATFLSSTKEGVAATRLPPTRVNWWSRARHRDRPRAGSLHRLRRHGRERRVLLARPQRVRGRRLRHGHDDPAGRDMDIAGDGDYHQGFAVTGQPLSLLTNNGLLKKSAGRAPASSMRRTRGAARSPSSPARWRFPTTSRSGPRCRPGNDVRHGALRRLRRGLPGDDRPG